MVVELKAVDTLLPVHKAQLLSYLKTLKRPLGLLINFKVQALRQGIQRVILSQ
ncbi:GxxExxY protein [Thiorhodococcus mannitoliphagus]|uniref:GxxExxY protein n=1 Tax=Thiorhodococcus mannitoliphagus TaxID=329406 RepID=UPI0030B878B4